MIGLKASPPIPPRDEIVIDAPPNPAGPGAFRHVQEFKREIGNAHLVGIADHRDHQAMGDINSKCQMQAEASPVGESRYLN